MLSSTVIQDSFLLLTVSGVVFQGRLSIVHWSEERWGNHWLGSETTWQGALHSREGGGHKSGGSFWILS